MSRRFLLPIATCLSLLSVLGGQNAHSQDLSQIQHWVFVIKENRTFDTYFGTFPGADGIPMDGIATAAVLVDLTPGGESGRDDVDRRVAGSEGHDDLAAGFVGSTFVPVHPADVHL